MPGRKLFALSRSALRGCAGQGLLGFRVPSKVLGFQGLGSGVQGLGCRVWGLLGFRVPFKGCLGFLFRVLKAARKGYYKASSLLY